jgi:hypothetical protein
MRMSGFSAIARARGTGTFARRITERDRLEERDVAAHE